MAKINRIGDIRKILTRLGIDITEEKIRKYCNTGFIKVSRSKAGYREFDEDKTKKAIRLLILIGLGKDPEDLKTEEDIVDTIQGIRHIVESM